MARLEYRLGALVLEPRRRLLHDGHLVPLGRKAVDILSVLAEAEGRLVTKDELMQAVWPGLVVEENAIQVHITAVRKALGSEAGRLVTVRGLGYQLDLNPSGTGHGENARRSVAVLPFANLSGDPNKDYLGDGLAEELITVLARASDLRVPARTSTFAYKGRNTDIRQIGRDLGVDAILEGSVRLAGEHIRITAQLIDARDGFHLWAQTYDRTFENLFALQDELARAIADGLRAHLSPLALPTQDLEAFHLYLQARGLAWRPSAENVARAITLLEKAIARDSRFARAYASLAWVINLGLGHNFLPSARFNEVRDNAEKALTLDPLLAEGHAMLGTWRAVTGDWSGAADCLERAAALDGDDPNAAHNTALYLLMPLGRLQAAREEAARTLALAPAWSASLGLQAFVSYIMGDLAVAEAQLDGAIALGSDPDHPPMCVVRAELAMRDSRGDEAAALMTPALAASLRQAGGADVCRTVYNALLGRRDAGEALREVDRLSALLATELPSVDCTGNAGLFIDWYVQLGALERAYDIVERIAAEREAGRPHDIFSLFTLWRPRSAPLRQDARFPSLVERLGMTGYWQRHGPPDGFALRNGRLVAQ